MYSSHPDYEEGKEMRERWAKLGGKRRSYRVAFPFDGLLPFGSVPSFGRGHDDGTDAIAASHQELACERESVLKRIKISLRGNSTYAECVM